MITYLNNCRGRDHAEIYGGNAFYDLDIDGAQATMGTNLTRGDICIVASYADDGEVEFAWWRLAQEKREPDKYTGKTCRVLRGKFVKSKKLSKRAAAKKSPFAVFFNVNGDFKQRSVITPK